MAKPKALAIPSRLIAVGPAGANPPIAAAKEHQRKRTHKLRYLLVHLLAPAKISALQPSVGCDNVFAGCISAFNPRNCPRLDNSKVRSRGTRPRSATRPPSALQLSLFCPASWSFSSASPTEKLPGFCRGGNSFSVWISLPTIAWAGAIRNMRSTYHFSYSPDSMLAILEWIGAKVEHKRRAQRCK